jgi:hypothetical protein
MHTHFQARAIRQRLHQFHFVEEMMAKPTGRGGMTIDTRGTEKILSYWPDDA